MQKEPQSTLFVMLMKANPGTFKDKVLLSEDPLSVIEGMIIAGYLFSAKAGYIYMRGEYRRIQKHFKKHSIMHDKLAFRENILGIEGFNYDITIISGAGAYIFVGKFSTFKFN